MFKRLPLALVFALLTLAACSRDQDSRNSPTRSAATPPQAADLSLEAALADLDAYIPKKMAQWNIPGAACAVVKDGAVVFAKGYGVKKIGGADPVDADTVFQVGSTSKAFTAAQIAQLVEEGQLAWTDPVRRHLPGFAMSDPWVSDNFLMADLMAQRSGLPEHAGDMMILLGYTPEEYLRALPFFKPSTSFRSAFAYQNGLFPGRRGDHPGQDRQALGRKRGRTHFQASGHDLGQRHPGGLRGLDQPGHAALQHPDRARAHPG